MLGKKSKSCVVCGTETKLENMTEGMCPECVVVEESEIDSCDRCGKITRDLTNVLGDRFCPECTRDFDEESHEEEIRQTDLNDRDAARAYRTNESSSIFDAEMDRILLVEAARKNFRTISTPIQRRVRQTRELAHNRIVIKSRG